MIATHQTLTMPLPKPAGEQSELDRLDDRLARGAIFGNRFRPDYLLDHFRWRSRLRAERAEHEARVNAQVARHHEAVAEIHQAFLTRQHDRERRARRKLAHQGEASERVVYRRKAARAGAGPIGRGRWVDRTGHELGGGAAR